MEDKESFVKYKRYYTFIEPFFKDPVMRTYSSLVLFFLTVSFFILFAIKPTLNTIISLNKQIADGRMTNEALQQKINALSLAQNEYASMTTYFPIIFSTLPEKPKVADFISTLERMASASGVTISSLQFQAVNLLDAPVKEEGNPSLREVGFNTVISGDYKNIVTFSEYLRKFQRVTSLANLNIGPSREKAGAKNTLTVNFTAKTYYFK